MTARHRDAEINSSPISCSGLHFDLLRTWGISECGNSKEGTEKVKANRERFSNVNWQEPSARPSSGLSRHPGLELRTQDRSSGLYPPCRPTSLLALSAPSPHLHQCLQKAEKTVSWKLSGLNVRIYSKPFPFRLVRVPAASRGTCYSDHSHASRPDED